MCDPPREKVRIGGREYVDAGVRTRHPPGGNNRFVGPDGVRGGMPVYFSTADTTRGHVTTFRARNGGRMLDLRDDAGEGGWKAGALAVAARHRAEVREGLSGDVKRYVHATVEVHQPAPTLKSVKFTKIVNPFTRETLEVTIDVETYDDVPGGLGNRVRNGRAIGTLSHGGVLHESWFDQQAQYILDLPLLDLLTVAAYANRSYAWLGPFQRGEGPPVFGTAAYLEMTGVTKLPMITPLFPQLFEILDTAAPRDMKKYFDPARFDLSTEADRKMVDDMLRPDAKLGTDGNVLPMEMYQMYLAYQKMLKKGAFSTYALTEALKAYVEVMKSIIEESPASERTMVVYRGTMYDPYVNVGEVSTKTTQFSSAALAAHHGLGYAGGGLGLLQRVTVLPGTRVLFIACLNGWSKHGEYEVLLNMGTELHLTDRGVDRVIVNRGGRLRSVQVTNAIAIRRGYRGPKEIGVSSFDEPFGAPPRTPSYRHPVVSSSHRIVV